MAISPEEFVPSSESVDPVDLTASIIDFPAKVADQVERIATGEISMELEVDDQIHELPPRQLELVPDPDEPGRFKAFARKHKKEAVLLGSVTTAAVLTAVATIGYVRKKK